MSRKRESLGSVELAFVDEDEAAWMGCIADPVTDGSLADLELQRPLAGRVGVEQPALE